MNRAWNKEQHSNFACTNPLHSKAASKLIGLIKKRGLKRVNIIYQDGAKWHSFKKYFTYLLKKNNIATGLKRKIQYHVFFSSVPKYLNSLPFESQGIFVAWFLYDDILEHFYWSLSHEMASGNGLWVEGDG